MGFSFSDCSCNCRNNLCKSTIFDFTKDTQKTKEDKISIKFSVVKPTDGIKESIYACVPQNIIEENDSNISIKNGLK